MSGVLSLVFTSTGAALSFTALFLAWRLHRKIRLSLEAAEELKAALHDRLEAADALSEWTEAADEAMNGVYSSRAVLAGTELARLLARHVLGSEL